MPDPPGLLFIPRSTPEEKKGWKGWASARLSALIRLIIAVLAKFWLQGGC